MTPPRDDSAFQRSGWERGAQPVDSHIDETAAKRRRLIVTHADSPIGRRLIKSLYHDPEVERVLAMGVGPPPRSFDRFLNSPHRRVSYARVDLTKHRPMSDFFHSSLVREARIDTLVHIPAHGDPRWDQPPLPGGLAERTAEARLVLEHALELSRGAGRDGDGLKNLVALGSAYVYRLTPGNANLLDESSELDLHPEVPAEIRCWIDCDMIFQSELNNRDLRIALLRIPSVVGSGGLVYMNPSLCTPLPARIRPLGFDPICALITDKDVARATLRAVHQSAKGIYNVSGREHIPFSVLADWTGASTIPLPSALMGMASRVAGFFGNRSLEAGLTGDHLHYGFSLDTERAMRELGYEPSYRIGLARAGDGKIRLETAPI